MSRTRRIATAAAALLALAAGAPRAVENGFAGTIVALQPLRESSTVALIGGPFREATLVDLHPGTNAWFVLALVDAEGRRSDFHLENADPRAQRLRLDAAGGGVLDIVADGRTTRCAPWPDLPRASRAHLAFAPLCGGRIYLRNPVRGNRTELEATTQFLRDHVPGGEKIVGFVRREFFADAYVESARIAEAAPSATLADPPGAPAAASVRPQDAARAIIPGTLGIDLGETSLLQGRWYAARGLPGVYMSAIEPEALAVPEGAERRHPWHPDAQEARALDYLVAFDLARFDVGFTLGTDHPRLDWSARVRDDMRDPSLPGPDGIGDAAPLARTGLLSPRLAPRAVATFAGGFKREHGAFRYGQLAQRNRGSHYGFVEEGVVFSRLQPGLATLYVLDDGTIDMKTWTERDDALLARLRGARQNGVALLEPAPGSGNPVPGALVGQWGAGNWSGSQDGKLRTLRAGACIAGNEGARYLVYGWFSTATPRTMAEVFRAYGCRYAMHLDMNALEHTYLALYTRKGANVEVEHLVRGMSVLDKQVGAELVPRFLAAPDDRDFFYVLRREPG